MAKRPDPRQLARLERIPGKARRYRDPNTGQTFSQRAVQEARQGGVSIELATELRKAGKPITKRADYYADLYAKHKRATSGKRTSKRDAINDPDFWNVVQRGLRSKNNSPRGPKARALVALGLRPADAPYPVGQSPKRRK